MLLKIYLKELKDCFRDRRTLLLTVFLPIVMMTGLMLFYEGMISDGEEDTYKLAVNQSIPADVENLFGGYENIELVKSENPEATVKEGEASAALIFAPGFKESVENGEEASVTIVGDTFSQKSSNLMNYVTNALTALEKMIISERLLAEGADPKLTQPFAVTQKEVSEEDPNINLLAMLIPMMLALAIGIGAGPAASDLFAGEKEKKTMEALLMTPVNRSVLLMSKWMTITTIGTITGIITLGVVAFEVAFLTEHLKKAVSFKENTYLIIGLALFISFVYAMLTASILTLTSIIGKTIKESQSYSTPIMMLAMFPTMIIANIGINELAFHHFAIPIMNLFSLLKELLFGIINVEHIMITVGSNLLAMIIIFVIGRVLFMKDKWVMN